MIFCILTMATGMVFSRVQWGAWWQSDPRQTSFAMVLMIYFAYFILRAALPDRPRKAVYSAGYALAATLPVLFLIYVFPYLPQIKNTSLHPTGTIMAGQVNGSYGQVLTTTMTLVGFLALWMFRLRVRAGELELKTYESIGLETHGDRSATNRVVRPVRLPDASGGETPQSASEPNGERA
jgi:heme exporter protein C